MRLFWGIIAVLVLVAGVVLGVPWYQQNRAATQAAAARAAAEQAAAASAQEPPSIATTPTAPPESDALSPKAPQPEPTLPAPTDLDRIAREQEQALREAHPNLPITVTPAENAPAAPTQTPAAAPAPPPPPAEVPKAKPDAEKPAGVALPGELPKTIGTYTVSPATFEIKDGLLAVDGKFKVRGVGTADDPYQIPWELLTSVEKDFDPHEGKKTIPGRIAFLHGKHVSLAGYVSFPLMVKEPRECLSMLNQWDGCCIGVPPTPFDAIEVQLTKPIRGNDRFATAGAVKGVLEVKPYVVGDWLVGLYVMESGELKASDYGAAGGF
ncbi:hypothetical protein PHYC_03149 [Phycisphaerales bacterium]|nr:hypothetical protein PHYC_03149 [Phycisphaerales bacterium]